MTQLAIKLTPVDSWFFRDGRPFNIGEASQTDLKSLFPPFSTTVVGAVRASLARGLGWNGRNDWDSRIKANLGNRQNLGPLRFKGPYLIRVNDGKEEILFPTPSHLLGKPPKRGGGQWTQITRLCPGDEICCDMGNGTKVRLPAADNASSLKSLCGSFLTTTDMKKILEDGDLKEIDPISSKKLWDFEYVIGIQRNFETRTAEEGALYSTYRVRLKPGVGLAVQVDGLENGLKLKTPLPMGGESRMAYSDPLNGEINLPEAPALKCSEQGNIRFTVILRTPAHFEGKWPGPGDELPGVPGSKVVSACLEHPMRIGGWNSLSKEPLPLKPFLPAGSIWFCEAEKSLEKSIRMLNCHHIGNLCEQGFGEMVIGNWG